MELEKNDPLEELDVLKFNLKWNVERAVRHCEDFIKLTEYNLKYFPKTSQRIVTWNSVILEHAKKLEEEYQSTGSF